MGSAALAAVHLHPERRGRWFLRPAFVLAEGDALEGLEVRLRPGANLKLRYEGDVRPSGYTIFLGEIPVAHHEISKGTPQIEIVPAGKLEVHWGYLFSKPAKTQSIELQVGETKDLTWNGHP